MSLASLEVEETRKKAERREESFLKVYRPKLKKDS